MKPRTLLAVVLLVSGLFDLLGGLYAVFDWRGASALIGGFASDWSATARAAHMAFADDALHQLWANLGTALVALGMTQLLAAHWLARGRMAGYDLARIVGWALLVAGGLMAITVPQLSSLLTEASRGLLILVLAIWARTAAEAEAPSLRKDD